MGAADAAVAGCVDREWLARCDLPAPGTPLTCAVSGGPDSLALLVLAAAGGCRVTAVHVDHGLRPGSAAEADVVADVARRVGAQFRSEQVHVSAGPNMEERARKARWAVLPGGSATGHTMDDQAETVLLNLLRGAGTPGLAGMRHGLRHPLLGLRRRDTLAVCSAARLQPVTDPSNSDPRHLRNRVRHELLPLCGELAGRDLVPILARQAALIADDVDLLDDLAATLDPADAAALVAAPVPLARRAVRVWLRGDAEHPPSAAAVNRVLAVAAGEMTATDVEPGLHVRRRRGRLLARSGPGDRGALVR